LTENGKSGDFGLSIINAKKLNAAMKIKVLLVLRNPSESVTNTRVTEKRNNIVLMDIMCLTSIENPDRPMYLTHLAFLVKSQSSY